MTNYEDSVEELFPFDSYREKQRKTLLAAARKLDSKNIKNVIIVAPTGVGKSAINVALGRASEGKAFYCTPQKQLREQLANDDVLAEYIETLKARRDYMCGVSGNNCEECYVNMRSNMSCSTYLPNTKKGQEEGICSYWEQKVRAIDAQIAGLTFAYLIVDNKLDGDGVSSFADRELLIVDECQNLENQAATMFAGFDITPYSVPDEVWDEVSHKFPWDGLMASDIEMPVRELVDRAQQYVNENRQQSALASDEDEEEEIEEPEAVKDCRKLIQKAEYFLSRVDEEPWVVDIDSVWYGGDKEKKVSIKPVHVDNFLKYNVWNRAEKRVLSTATMPFQNEPSKWCNRIGLDPARTHVVKVGMPFPKENRPIYTGHSIAEMSGGGDDEHWNEVMAALNRISGKHEGLNGLVHTASYNRAERVYDHSDDYDNLRDNVIFHTGNEDTDKFIAKWQSSNKDIVVTPSMTEGVDLDGDMCRWQALLKVPFPSPGNSRVEYLLNEEPWNGWPWYWQTTAMRIVQSAGRAVRSKDDYASYYVLDESFDKLRSKIDEFPEWFEEAIVDDTGDGYSALDW